MAFLTLTASEVLIWAAWIGAVGTPLLALLVVTRFSPSARWSWPLRLAFGALGLIYSVCIWAMLIEPELLAVRHVTVVSAAWRGPPLRIGAISDTHSGAPHVNPARVRKLMARLSAERPDIAVFLGDYAGGHAEAGERTAANRAAVIDGITALGEARAPLGRIGVLGNHDWWYGGPQIEAAMQRAGLAVLENRAIRIDRPGGAFWVAGVADVISYRAHADPLAATAAVPPGEPVILLSHWPDPFAQVPPRVALTLAGHTHCGQARLPIIGALVHVSPAARYWNCGLYDVGGRKLYVTGGVGASVIPARFGAPPEIVIVTLKAP